MSLHYANTSTGTSGYNLTDVGNAERLVNIHGQDIRWEPRWQRWFCWTGKRWEIDETSEIERRAKSTIRAIYQEAAAIDIAVSQTCGDANGLKEKAKELRKHADRSEQKPRIDSLVALAKSEPGVSISHEQLDADPMLLNTLSGTIDLRTGALSQHQRIDFMTKMIAQPFEGINTPAPLWEQFIDEIMCGDREMVDFLQKAVGYALTGRIDEQCLFLLHGNGSNGKSTFVESIRDLFGDYAQQADFATFLEQDGDKVRNDIARMVGARFIAATEGPEGKRLNEAVVKHLTGGDRVTARFLHREYFEFSPTHKIFLATNHKPNIKGADNGIWRRLRIIPFSAYFSDEKKDPQFPSKLKSEFPGILAWAVRGCLAWQNNGLGIPKAVEAATSDYRAEMDIIQTFITDCCSSAPTCTVRSQELYDAYRQWAEANGHGVFSQTRFSLTLSEKNIKSKKTAKGKLWEGIGLLSSMMGVTPQGVTSPGNRLTVQVTHQPTTPIISNKINHKLKLGEDLVFAL